jgi:hypothetical protein
MAESAGLRTVQPFPTALGRPFVEAKAAAAKQDGATSADITEDGDDYVLTVDWPALD